MIRRDKSEAKIYDGLQLTEEFDSPISPVSHHLDVPPASKCSLVLEVTTH